MKIIKALSIIILFFISNNIFSQQTIEDFLIPEPKQVSLKDGYLCSSDSEYSSAKEIKALKALNNLVSNITNFQIIGEINFNSSINVENTLSLNIDNNLPNKDAYTISINGNDIKINAGGQSGLFYAKQTLKQVLCYSNYTGKAIPQLQITDTPDFERRGYMLDISRDKVPKMETLYEIVDLLAEWKINELQLYMEHTFTYKNHKEVWEGYSPMTPEQIQDLDAYCKSKFIDLVPNQNSFGHMRKWLSHEEYVNLAECPTDCKTIWGLSKQSALDPTNPGSLALVSELFAELTPNFSSEYLNIGCDETVELGTGKTKRLCKKEGVGKVYLDYLLKLNDEVNSLGLKAQFWGDIIVNHPEYIDQIPKNMTALVWGYETTFSSGKSLPRFQKAGIDYYVCPGTSSWSSLIGRNDTGFKNLKQAASYGKKYGAKGYMNTNWGDNGHWQPLSVCYPGMMLGASYAWNAECKTEGRLENLLNRYVFLDPSNNTAKAVLKLGKSYLKAKLPEGNGNVYHLMLMNYNIPIKDQYQTKHLTASNLKAADNEIDDALEILSQAKPQKDSAIVIDELLQASRMAKHGAMLGEFRFSAPKTATKNISDEQLNILLDDINDIIETQKQLWIVRNREGGLNQSLEKLEALRDYYKECLD